MATDLPSGVQTSSTPAPPPGAVPVYQVASPDEAKQQKIDFIKVYGHSNILYWWPVWAVCFALAAWTYADGGQMAVHTAGGEEAVSSTDPAKKTLANRLIPAQMTVARTNTPGVLFCVTLLLTAVVSSITLRGMISVIALISLVVVVLVLSLFNWWDDVFRFFGGLDVRMNAAGYLFLGTPLLVLWLLVVLIYDRGSYVIFDEGQIRYVREIGENELVVPADRAQVEKKRSDVFRHWLVGFGTGDLVIRTGQGGQSIELENVVGISRKLDVINTMLRKKSITTG